MKNRVIITVWLFLALVACNNDDDQPTPNNEKEITAFSFLAKDNDVLSEDIRGSIDQDKKTISLEFPENTEITKLKPTIDISENATVNPENKIEKDFAKPVIYTVTAEDKTTAKYTVTVTVAKSNAKQITSFVFLASDNDKLTKDVEATIDETNKIVTAELPYNAQLNALTPTIAISSGAEVDPKDKTSVDFTNDIAYTVTAADGTTEKYTVTVANAAITDRDVLIAWYNLNPNNTLTWDFSKDISEWEGITVENGRVTIVQIRNASISIITPLIGNLEKLIELNLASNQLTSLPVEVGQLKELLSIDVYGNRVLASLPTEIGDLTKLVELNLGYCNLSAVPKEISDLTNLQELKIDENQLTVIPAEIGNLSNLKRLELQKNQLTDLPPELGMLSSLIVMQIEENQITVIPQSICDLDDANLILVKDPEAKCPNQ